MPLAGTVAGAGADQIDALGHTIQELYERIDSQGRTIQKQSQLIESMEQAITRFNYLHGLSFFQHSDNIYNRLIKNEDIAIVSFKAAAKDGYHPAIYQLAASYHRHKEFKEAIEYYVKAHELGNPDAAFGLGFLFEQCCDDNIQNELTARQWYNIAVEQHNHSQACVQLGLLIERGPQDESNEKDYEERFKAVSALYRRSAEQDNANGQYNYARCLERSMQRLEDRDQKSQLLQEVRNWYRKAAYKKHIPATMRLGLSYQSGIGNVASINREQAIKCYNSLSLIPQEKYAIYLNSVLYKRDIAARKEIIDVFLAVGIFCQDFNQRVSLTMLRCVAKEGHAEGLYCLGKLYHDEKISLFITDLSRYDEALSCYTQAYENKFHDAIHKIFLIYKNNYDDLLEQTHKDKALEWLQKAVKHSIPGAKKQLQKREKELQKRGIKRKEVYRFPLKAPTIFGTREGGGSSEKTCEAGGAQEIIIISYHCFLCVFDNMIFISC